MDEKSKKTLNLFKLWLHSNYPNTGLYQLVVEFENDYVDFKEVADEFVKLVINKIDSEAIMH